ncbi:MAG: hypothetical protein QOH43_2089 [Solirubrobacteraceae bacterium]|jgi:uncharacterized membrane protein|nr:hypothetical protein [Solirubrobacteraceae bacterium]
METLAVTPPVPLSKAGRIAHDVGLAGLLGGTLFGRLALHPSVTAISDPYERGKLVNAAWRRYGIVNTLSLAAVVTGWAGARLDEASDRRLSPTERRLARAKDALVGFVAVTGIAAAIEGTRFSREAPQGAVPLQDGDHTAPEATRDQKSVKRTLNALGAASLAGEVALVAVNAALDQESHRRPPLRRLVPVVGRI